MSFAGCARAGAFALLFTVGAGCNTAAVETDPAAQERPTRPSCLALPNACSAGKGCCASTLVTGGEFQIDNETDPAFAATVSDFWLDRFEVTVGRFRNFADAYPASVPATGDGRNLNNPADPGWDSAWAADLPEDRAALLARIQCDAEYQTWGKGDDLAINCVTWYEATAFCIWDGGRLPTNAELNYAAAAGSEQRFYPWSKPGSDQTIDPSFAVFAPATYVAPVGSKSPRGDGKYGQSDLAGNVWEWVQDWYVPYPHSACDNCAALVQPPDTSERVIRGGSAYDSPSYVGTAVLDVYNPTTRFNYIGFRCARNR